MNNLQISLSQTTLNTFLKKSLSLVRQSEPISNVIVEKNGVKVTANIQLKSIEVDDLNLAEPNKVSLNNVKLSFELLNVVVEVDIKRIHDSIKVLNLPGDRLDVEISWDFFEGEPDIKLTLGIEDYFSPQFTAEMNFSINGLDVMVGLSNFNVHSLNIASNLGEKIEDQIINEVKQIIKEKIGEWADKVLDFIGDLARFLPVDNMASWIVVELSESEVFKHLVEKAVKDNVKEEKVYTIPNKFELGKDQTKVNVSLADENTASVHVENGTLIGLVNFKDI
ncbi:uncharacterized protein YpmS [Paenibacillus intestini]|uniref:Uncharacterized protein n=1 Tax=Paenibacillus cucumis (ex Kampfer et al. 2016) TaxID=1776858 RepID=A0ABS7KCV2_9BACL|nr:hypothetical protein [Paenibacillus cucumis (ex Kampfer et al. 2016)]MBY0201777.1 hypothetical protein [Paenibacillus cucumis (ex Kampfer et al. 2016)]MDP9698790.1 uncharacterized protein YpmS [Paenibacillus intestini]